MTTALFDAGVLFADGNIQPYPVVAVRQTVLSGPVDTNGQSAFGGATGSTVVTAAGTLIVTAANGVSNRTGSKLNPSWPGLNVTGMMFLYVDVNADGTFTEGVGSLLRVEQPGGTPSIAAGQHTYNIKEAKGYIGNGATAAAGYRVYVGECTVVGGVVQAGSIVWYALNGSAYGVQAVLAAGSSYASNPNLGTKLQKVTLWLECITAEFGYVAGDRISISYNGNYGSGPSSYGTLWKTTRNVFVITTLSIAPAIYLGGGLAYANWSAGWLIERAF